MWDLIVLISDHCLSVYFEQLVPDMLPLYFSRACDNCEEWYHGDCIGITEVDANDIKHYYCDKCQGMEKKIPLPIEYLFNHL